MTRDQASKALRVFPGSDLVDVFQLCIMFNYQVTESIELI